MNMSGWGNNVTYIFLSLGPRFSSILDLLPFLTPLPTPPSSLSVILRTAIAHVASGVTDGLLLKTDSLELYSPNLLLIPLQALLH